MAIISGYPTVTPSTSDHILGTQVEPITLEIRTVQFTVGSINGTGGQVNSLTTTGTGAATLISNVLNIPTPVIPTVPFTSLTTTGTSGASTLTSGVLNIPQYAGELETTLTLTSAQMRSLHTGAIQLLPSPGGTKVIKLLAVSTYLDSDGSRFTSVGSAGIDIVFATNVISVQARIPILLYTGTNDYVVNVITPFESIEGIWTLPLMYL